MILQGILLSSEGEKQTPIPDYRIKEAVSGMENILGRAATEPLIQDLETYGIIFNGKSHYSLLQLESAFARLFGGPVALMLIEQIQKKI